MSDSLIRPVSPADKHAEERFSQGIREAEAATVPSMLASDASPAGLDAVLENAAGFAENVAVKHTDPATPPVACAAGCAWCCYQTVPITAPEAFRIARFVRGGLSGHPESEVLSHLDRLDRQTRRATPHLRAQLHLPCAFLREKRCSIYPVRPLPCMEFTSFKVADCEQGFRLGFDFVRVIHNKARMIAFNAVEKGLADGLRVALPRADHAPLELTAGVLDVLAKGITEASWVQGEGDLRAAHLNPDLLEGAP